MPFRIPSRGGFAGTTPFQNRPTSYSLKPMTSSAPQIGPALPNLDLPATVPMTSIDIGPTKAAAAATPFAQGTTAAAIQATQNSLALQQANANQAALLQAEEEQSNAVSEAQGTGSPWPYDSGNSSQGTDSLDMQSTGSVSDQGISSAPGISSYPMNGGSNEVPYGSVMSGGIDIDDGEC
jgi:hypothetical protein